MADGTPPWAASVVARVHAMAIAGGAPELIRARAAADDVVEVVFRWSEDGIMRGIRLDRADVERGPALFQDRTVDEIAFYLVTCGVEEPRDATDFDAPGTDGIAWMPGPRWMRDVDPSA